MNNLNHHQRYLLEEFAEHYFERSISRHDLLHRSLMATGSIALTATVLFALGCSSGDGEPAPVGSVPGNGATTSAGTTEATGDGDATATPVPTAAAPEDVPTADIEAEDISFSGPDAEILGYLARPVSEGAFPAVLIIHENRGLLPHFKDVARRYAGEGFVTFAIDLASRLGGSKAAGAQVGQVAPADQVTDLQAAIDYLQEQPFVVPDAIGVTGFCFGGGYTFDIAAASPDLKAAVPYYGTARRALEIGLGETQAAVLVMYGENDSRITSERETVEVALKQCGSPYEIIVHHGAGHAFFNDTGGSYNPTAAQNAWAATLAWFREHLS